MQLLEMVHDNWKYCNAILHEHDGQGLKKQAAIELEAAINAEFTWGTANLAMRDRHYIARGCDNVMSLLASDKQAWLRGVQLARESRAAIVERLR